MSTNKNLRSISPYDLKEPTGREPIHIKFDMFMQRPLKVPYPDTQNINGIEMTVLQEEVQHQLTSFALEWERWPIPEHYVEKAMDDAKQAVIKKMRELNLCR